MSRPNMYNLLDITVNIVKNSAQQKMLWKYIKQDTTETRREIIIKFDSKMFAFFFYSSEYNRSSTTIFIYMILGNMFLSNSNSSDVAASYMMLLSNNEYQCSGCEHRSKFKNNMIKHIDSKHIHHGPESCQFCQKLCSSKQALQKHISRYHRDLNL